MICTATVLECPEFGTASGAMRRQCRYDRGGARINLILDKGDPGSSLICRSGESSRPTINITLLYLTDTDRTPELNFGGLRGL